MFRKKYKVKTSSSLRGSERKKLKNALETKFSNLSSDNINDLVPSKSDITLTKAMTHSGTAILIYSMENNPMFFQVEQQIYPTIYAVWKFPSLLPTIPTVPLVFDKISNGADLMAPGIIVNDVTINEFKNIKPSDTCAVRLEGNKTPIAIGVALISDLEMSADDRKGKAVQILHVYKDMLWESGNQTHLSVIPDNIFENENCLLSQCDDDVTNSLNNDNPLDTAISSLSLSESQGVEVAELPADAEITVNYSMDDILMQCFLLALKSHGKKITLPILTSTFYRTYVLACCPSDLNLDIKKTTYKKLSVFLKAMVKESLIQVKELTKGVESIVHINLENEKLQQFRPDSKFKEHVKIQKEEAALEETASQCVQENFLFPEISEMFIVSGQVKDLFEKLKFKKGDALSSKAVRETIKTYVQENNLQKDNDPRFVVLDPVLTHCLLKSHDIRTELRWDELFEIVMSRMSPAYQISFGEEKPQLKKGHIEPIDISIATRTGNKKVTLINNLENFGISPEKLANHMQTAVAASTSVYPAPNGKGAQVLIQGSQLKYLQTLLFDTYKVPRKYVRGLENISAKKK